MKQLDHRTMVLALCTVALLIVAWQGVRPKTDPAPSLEDSGEACIGTPITVDYPFDGRIAGPHECKVQCDNNKPRYILYSNGLATQCETPPGCNDWGEDHSTTCRPPNASAKS